jgi:Glycosyl transferase 4-like domain
MVKKVLIVSPHFPPINAPDHQRVRMALTHLRNEGWEPVILAVDPEASENSLDYSLLSTIPDDIEIHRVEAIPANITRRVGLGSLALRCLPYLRQKGGELLSQGNFNLIFFSTSLFPVMACGPLWRKRYGVPYVLDFQDPWIPIEYEGQPANPPGGKIKYALSTVLARALEPSAIRNAAHLVVVSPAYPEQLRERYAELNSTPITVLPFAAAESDLISARTSEIDHGVFKRCDGLTHWVYAGIAGPMMHHSIRAFFRALESKVAEEPELRHRLRVHFIGTEYGGGDENHVGPLAREFNLEDIVCEQTRRLPFLTTLKLLDDADALLIFGSADPSYTASKIFPYILAAKPLLVIAHKNSSTADIVRRTRGGIVVDFDVHEEIAELSKRIYESWFAKKTLTVETDWQAFEQYTARSMTRKLSQVFAAASESSSPVNSNSALVISSSSVK